MKKIMNEKLTITTSNPVRARFYEYPRFTYPWHFHSEYEIIYVEKGEGDCLVGDSIISYSKGDLILFGSNCLIVCKVHRTAGKNLITKKNPNRK